MMPALDRKAVLLSAYRFDPYGVSEAFSGYKWAEMIARHFDLTLATPAYNRAHVQRYLHEHPESPLAQTRFVFVEMSRIDERLGLVGSAMKPGFFLYEQRLLKQLRAQGVRPRFDAVMHRTPVSFRFRTRLGCLGAPLVVGPISGGLHPPAELADFFGAEPPIFRLRALDGLLLRWRWWTRPLENASAVLLSSQYLTELLPQRVMRNAHLVLETGIDCSALVPDKADLAGRERFEIVFAGRLTRYKAPTLAIEAFARFLARLPAPCDVRLTMIGDGEEAAACVEAAAAAGVADRVELAGWLPKDEALRRLRASDVFLFPSITEAAGNVYLEAMALGVPMVIVDYGGGRDLVPADAAVKVPVGDVGEMVGAMTEGLLELYRDSGLRERMGEAGRSHACTEYDWSVLERRVRDVLDSVIEGADEQL